MSYDFRAKGSADFIAGKKDQRMFHNIEDHGRLYREGWHDARRKADQPAGFTHPEGCICRDCLPGNPETGLAPAAPLPDPAKTPPRVDAPQEQAKDGSESGAGWQGFSSGSWHFFDKGARKSACKRATRATGPAHDNADGLVCSLCEDLRGTASQLDLF
jgi:hypothetical protein